MASFKFINNPAPFVVEALVTLLNVGYRTPIKRFKTNMFVLNSIKLTVT